MYDQDKKVLYWGIIVLVGCLIAIFTCVVIWAWIDAEYNTAHQVGVYACPKCNSKETSGNSTYWTNDGMYVKNKDFADYTLFSCHCCNYSWKVPI